MWVIEFIIICTRQWWKTKNNYSNFPANSFQLMVIGEHTVTRGQAHAHQSKKWSRVAIHKLSGCTSAQIGRQRVGHATQQVVDERPPREVPSVLPAGGTRRTTLGDDGIQRSGVHASGCRPGSHQQPGVIGTAEAQ